MRDNILIYTNFLTRFEKLSDEQFGILMRVILEYQITDEIPQIDDLLVALAFDSVKPEIDRNNANYEEKCQKNRENGHKGGRPKKEDENQTVYEKPNGFLENQTVFEKPNGFFENHNDNDNDLNNNSINSLHSFNGITSDESDKSEEENYSQFMVELKEQQLEREVEQVVSEYNQTCEKLPKVQKITKERKKKVKARLKTYSRDDIYQAFKLAAASDFMNGKTGWKASFDWFFTNDQNIQKVLEGNYSNKSPTRNKFNKFDQRSYDMNALEDVLINRSG